MKIDQGRRGKIGNGPVRVMLLKLLHATFARGYCEDLGFYGPGTFDVARGIANYQNLFRLNITPPVLSPIPSVFC